MHRHNGPISPLSMNSSDSFASRYGPPSGPSSHNINPLGGTPNDVPYGGGPYGAARPQRPSPPGSQHPSGSTDMSRPSAASSGSMRPPSSASSIGGRSDGRFGPSGGARDSGRSMGLRPDNEDVLSRHYQVLKNYLATSLRDEKGNLKPNRARDKLLRLSVTQFMELSTDVYDELIRREDERLQRVRDVPRYLLPKNNFHPKRNQARQKLSTLPIERFKQLATDVFYELERRIPRFTGADGERPLSSTSQGRGMPPGYRVPLPGQGRPGMPQAPYQSFRPASPMGAGSRRPSEQSDRGDLMKPLPKTFQSNTIVPNKSTMVEDDDEEDLGISPYGDERGTDMLSSPLGSDAMSPGAGRGGDPEVMKAQEAEIATLKSKVQEMEGSLLQRDRDLEGRRLEMEDKERNVSEERREWHDLRETLEQKVLDAQRLHETMKNELDTLRKGTSQQDRDLHATHEQNLRDITTRLETTHTEKTTLQSSLSGLQTEHSSLRAQLEDLSRQRDTLQNHLRTREAELDEIRDTPSSGSADQETRIHALEEELAAQEQRTSEVQAQAMQHLAEMRALSSTHHSSTEESEAQHSRITGLESDISTWRTRYAKLRAQNRSLRASTMGLPITKPALPSAFVSETGLVDGVAVTNFQLAIESLLLAGRQSEPEPVLSAVKEVAVCIAAITSPLSTSGYPTPSPSPHSSGSGSDEGSRESLGKLKARVMGTANSLITAGKLHVASHGLSPVGLLDAAASNLTHATIELVKSVGIRPASLVAEPLPSEDDEPEPVLAPIGKLSVSRGSNNLLDTIHKSSGSVESVKPLEIKRSNTSKKVNGWFGWGKGGSEEEVAMPNGIVAKGDERSGREGEGEYDPYR
ncbi:component of the polarisome [Oleoguttula sp. CCFEE 5521]